MCFIYTGRAAEAAGHSQWTTTIGVLSAITIIVGLLPQFWEVYKFKAVVGISLVFLAIDLAGGLFSTLSLVWAPGEFDTLASISYAAVAVLELIIFILVPILNPAHRRRVAAAKQRQDEEALSGSQGGGTATETGEMAEVKKADPAVESGRRNSQGSERGPLGWMDEGVALEEQRRHEAAEQLQRPARADTPPETRA